MNRITLYDDIGNYVGWFDRDKAKVVAMNFNENGVYLSGKKLLKTAKGNFVVYIWSNDGPDVYVPNPTDKQIVEIITKDNEADIDTLPDNIKKIINEYEY